MPKDMLLLFVRKCINILDKILRLYALYKKTARGLNDKDVLTCIALLTKELVKREHDLSQIPKFPVIFFTSFFIFNFIFYFYLKKKIENHYSFAFQLHLLKDSYTAKL